MRTLVGVLLLVVIAPTLAGPADSDPMAPESYQQAAVRDLVHRVNQAAELVRQQGEQAFPQFRARGPWFDGADDFYLFVFDLEGNQVVNAAFPALEFNRLDWRDTWGKPMFQLAIERLAPAHQDRRFWWIHYLWPKPREVEAPSWKSTYMVRTQTPAGQVYVVAAGLYDLDTEPLWVELLVEEAVELIAARGDAAFPVISSRASPFMYRDTYVFVVDEHGVERANAAFPELIGQNLLALPDFPFADLVREQIAFVRQHGAGWIAGAWPRPGETEPVEQQVYLKGVEHDGTLLIVGSGIYAPPADQYP